MRSPMTRPDLAGPKGYLFLCKKKKRDLTIHKKKMYDILRYLNLFSPVNFHILRPKNNVMAKVHASV